MATSTRRRPPGSLRSDLEQQRRSLRLRRVEGVLAILRERATGRVERPLRLRSRPPGSS